MTLLTQHATTQALFEKIGGEFILPSKEIAAKLRQVKAFVFDWDGVFNDGIKGEGRTSGFSEADAMALHILRYAYWRLSGHIPLIAIITAQKNESAVKFAQREHLHKVFFNYKDKYVPVELLAKEYKLEKMQIASAFDDIIDYPLAASTGLRFLIRRNASPLFTEYFRKHRHCDYITGSQSPEHPIREIAELAIGLLGIYDEVLISRFTDRETYQKYWAARNAVETDLVENKA